MSWAPHVLRPEVCALLKAEVLNGKRGLLTGLLGRILNEYVAAFWIAPLVTASVQYSRRNVKTLQIDYRRLELIFIVARPLRRDGILYFAGIFVADLLIIILYSVNKNWAFIRCPS